MRLENKLKQATLTVALKYMLRDKAKGKERACRNMIEFGNSLNGDILPEETLAILYKELIDQVDTQDEIEIKNWLIEKFNLF